MPFQGILFLRYTFKEETLLESLAVSPLQAAQAGPLQSLLSQYSLLPFVKGSLLGDRLGSGILTKVHWQSPPDPGPEEGQGRAFTLMSPLLKSWTLKESSPSSEASYRSLVLGHSRLPVQPARTGVRSL